MLCLGKVPLIAQDAYADAANKAKNGEYDEARQLLQKILVNIPEHQDAKFLMGVVHAWDKQYDKARPVFEDLIAFGYNSVEVFQALSRLEIWDNNPVQALEVTKRGLEKYPNDITLKYLKAAALAALENDDEAIAILESVLAEEPEYEEAQKLLKELLARRSKNAISVDYSYAWFSNTFTPWHRTSLEYRRNLPIGPVIGRVNYAYMFDRSTLQGEVDAYPAINSLTYSYLNVGVSDGKVFPNFRFGAELYRLLPANFEASVGMRGLYFTETDVYIYTAQVGNYLPGYWVSFRGFFTAIDEEFNATGLFVGRKYFSSKDHYFSVYASSGAAPLKVATLAEIQRLDANMVALDYQYPLSHQFFIRGYAEYQHERYPEIRSTHRYTISVRLEKRF